MLPRTGILVAQSGKTIALISMILEQYRGCFERINLFIRASNVTMKDHTKKQEDTSESNKNAAAQSQLVAFQLFEAVGQ